MSTVPMARLSAWPNLVPQQQCQRRSTKPIHAWLDEIGVDDVRTTARTVIEVQSTDGSTQKVDPATGEIQ
jgi:hypothetical protein